MAGEDEEGEEEKVGDSFPACDGNGAGDMDMVEEDGAGDAVVGEGG
jgi:hypothetical protein